jgi:hypothetical protein
MKNLFLILTLIAFVIISTTIYAQIVAPLGQGNFVLKFDYVVFTDRYFDDLGNQDDGIYLGLEGYGKIASNFYLGGEIGQAANVSLMGEDINFVSIELNTKYAKEFAHNFILDFGAGLSYSYAEHRYIFPFVGISQVSKDWLFGGQIFTDFSYRINWFSIGVNTKYKITQKFKEQEFDLSNFRLGVNIGIII